MNKSTFTKVYKIGKGEVGYKKSQLGSGRGVDRGTSTTLAPFVHLLGKATTLLTSSFSFSSCVGSDLWATCTLFP